MCGRMVFGEIICMIGVARAPENVELALACVVMNPIKMHVNGLGAFMLDCVIDDAYAVLLLVCRGVAGCRWPSTSKVMQMGHAICVLRKSAPNSASAALATTCHMLWQRTWRGPLSGGVGSVAVGTASSLELRK